MASDSSYNGYNISETNMSTVERALAIAREAHQGQVDKAGAPYVGHPVRVAHACVSDDAKIVAQPTQKDIDRVAKYLRATALPQSPG